ncbi:variable surface lipoprotein [Mycoplasmopsis verecunda]|uniref:Lipoprotein n=1 Tax=Mycoplasmopsis verecunda TaxID=171291 RepID=A0A1T4MHU9_9BACT|nr:variable surface lipoprotein [Mycoplasmopsis verecunda]WPB54724.1 variable surface lipoprotein [Mycoplasmopsis verecunda]SJZ66660.1 hypothetical protein SAMN02745154_00711 [Mycoplasmopsis verecunda]
MKKLKSLFMTFTVASLATIPMVAASCDDKEKQPIEAISTELVTRIIDFNNTLKFIPASGVANKKPSEVVPNNFTITSDAKNKDEFTYTINKLVPVELDKDNYLKIEYSITDKINKITINPIYILYTNFNINTTQSESNEK